MKNAVLQAFVINLVCTLVFLIIIFFVVYPRSQWYLDKIHELEELVDKHSNLIKKGMTLAEVKQASSKYNIWKDRYTQRVIASFDPLLYTKNFSNNQNITYKDFLSTKQDSIDEVKQSSQYQERDKTLAKILPVYSFDNSISEDSLTDFYFTNYIERVLYTFNLTHDGEIWLGGLKKVQDTNESSQKSKKPIEIGSENIYQIWMDFSVTGQKKDVIDFIHFLENVGSISIEEEGVMEYSDSFLTRKLEWDTVGNIYKNQLADIESISLSAYPDSGSTEVGEDLIETIWRYQARQKYSANIRSSFYVSGLPSYQIQAYIENFYSELDDTFQKLDLLSKTVTREKNTYTQSQKIQSVQELQSLTFIMNVMKEELDTKRRIPPENIDEILFDEFSEHYSNLKQIQEVFTSLENIFTDKE